MDIDNVLPLRAQLDDLQAHAGLNDAEWDAALVKYQTRYLDELYFKAAALKQSMQERWDTPLDPHRAEIIYGYLNLVIRELQQQVNEVQGNSTNAVQI